MAHSTSVPQPPRRTGATTGGALLVLTGLAIVVIGLIAGYLSSFTDTYEDATVRPGDTVPFSAHHRVSFGVTGDLADGTPTCKVTGPDRNSYPLAGAADMAGLTLPQSFTTGPAGDYRIACDDYDVVVKNDAGSQPAADLMERKANHQKLVTSIIGGVVAVGGVLVLVMPRRA